MANIGLAYDNKMDGATLTGGSWEVTLPLTNSQDRILSRFARSTDAVSTNTYFDFALGDNELLQVFGLIRHAIAPGGTVRVVLSQTTDFSGIPFDLTGATIDYDTGVVEAWPSVFSTEGTAWESDNWWFGRLDQQLVDAYGQTNFILPINSGTGVVARYGRVYISQGTGPTAPAYVQFGRAWIGPWFQPERNYIYGAELNWENLTTRRRALGGMNYYRKRRMVRVFRLGFDSLSEAEAYQVFDIKRILDIDGQVIIIADPDDQQTSFQRNFLGNVSSPDPVTHPNYGQYQSAFEIREEV
jgi:hypothetical protein